MAIDNLLNQIINLRPASNAPAVNQLTGAFLQSVERGREQDQRDQALEERRQASVVSQILNTAPEQRAAVIAEFAKVDPDQEFSQELADFGQIDAVSQDRIGRQLLQAGGFESFIPQAPKQERITVGEKQTVIDQDGNIIFEGRESLVGGGLSAEDEQKQANVLRKEVASQGKNFRLIEEAKNRIDRTGTRGTAASDLSLIFNFMKINDPGSTVREGEFANAQNAAGVPDRIRSTYNRVREGTRLTPEQREDFIATADELFQGQRDAFDSQVDRILQQGEQDGISGVRILGQRRFDEFQARRGASTPQAQPAESAATTQFTDEQLVQMAQERNLL